jgi:hypothetical protein
MKEGRKGMNEGGAREQKKRDARRTEMERMAVAGR